ncbi:hypothetical protein C8T65DRAFT_663785 [Cerioporus squamosus]|nr:hypothetical protein C8T65DRAFT_663785 [Cerioporus squamosus]
MNSIGTGAERLAAHDLLTAVTIPPSTVHLDSHEFLNHDQPTTRVHKQSVFHQDDPTRNSIKVAVARRSRADQWRRLRGFLGNKTK